MSSSTEIVRHKRFFKGDYFKVWVEGVERYGLYGDRIEKHFLDPVLGSLQRGRTRWGLGPASRMGNAYHGSLMSNFTPST